MKIAKIKPIFKSGVKTDTGSYRPISTDFEDNISMDIVVNVIPVIYKRTFAIIRLRLMCSPLE